MKRMRGGRSWKLFAVIGAVVTTVTVGLVATTASAKSDQDVNLTVSLFGDFGYHDLYKKYEKAHPGVTIKESIQDFGTHHTQLAQRIAVGAGAADIEAIEVGYIPQFTPQPQNFVDLRQYGASALKKLYLPWKWAQAVGKGGAVVGLGTDVGSLAICYRKDMFAKAGLPTNRVAVSKLWPTWQAYINTGKRYQAKAPKGTFFFDSGSNVYNAMVGQLNPAYYNAKGDLIITKNPRIKAAWDMTISGQKAGEDAGLAAFSPRLEHRLQEGRLRHRHVSRLDDGLHPGPGAGDEGQVGHRRDARHGRQLGRLVPRRPEAVVEPGRGSRSGEVPDLSQLAGVDLQADGQPAQPDGSAQEPSCPELQEPVLQQRSGRARSSPSRR